MASAMGYRVSPLRGYAPSDAATLARCGLTVVARSPDRDTHRYHFFSLSVVFGSRFGPIALSLAVSTSMSLSVNAGQAVLNALK
jgi:hypothetical protein